MPAGPSNVSVLTRENTVWAAKRRNKREQVKEILFDETARRDFLTGFHKRKLARQEAGKAKAIERERQERLEARREQRKALAERAAQNAKEVERALRGNDYESDSDASTSKGKERAPIQPEENEYENQEQLATVTVIEEFNPEELTAAGVTRPEDYAAPTPKAHRQPKVEKIEKKKKSSSSTKSSKSKFTYESKAARKLEQKKQKARRNQKGRLAPDGGGSKSRRRR